MPDPRRATRARLTFLLCAMAVLATVAEVASTPLIRKLAVVGCFVLLAGICLLPGKSSSVAVDSTSDNEDPDGRQSLLARLGWAVWMSIAAAACFGIGQLAGALLPPLQLPFRILGVVLLVVAAYKLVFGRRSNNTDIDI